MMRCDNSICLSGWDGIAGVNQVSSPTAPSHEGGVVTITLTINERQYQRPCGVPVVGVCIDGSQPEADGQPGYIEEAIKAGVAPFFERLMKSGTRRIAKCVMPSFTNPNNLSIATGHPPAYHGIAGNYFYDRDCDEEVMMNDPGFLRAGTIFRGLQQAGTKVCVITAKDKLRLLLGDGLDMSSGSAICFSAERADQVSAKEHGIEDVLALAKMPLPDVYSTELSEFVLASGVAIMRRERPDLMYLSTTDYLQHKVAPGSDEANEFYSMMDRYLGELDEMGCVLAITADHGMSAKHDTKGRPQIAYLQSLVEDWIGERGVRVILPITDPYVAHHGALGSFATIHIENASDRLTIKDKLSRTPGIMKVYTSEEACNLFQLPADRIGDLVVFSDRDMTLGTRADRHDLSQLNGPLRSHGGLTEQSVPFLVNRAVDFGPERPLYNYDLFEVAFNHTLDETVVAE